MKILSKMKLYQKILVALILAAVIGAAAFWIKSSIERVDEHEASLLISEMEISILQCRRDEKNFMLRHDQASSDNFARRIQDLKKYETGMRALTNKKVILGMLDDIKAETKIYENNFQDIKGLYDSKSFGTVSDPALLKISDEVTLMAEPAVTPSSVETTRSLIEAGRNLEYFIQYLPDSFTALLTTLNLRRWEKNLQKIYHEPESGTDFRAVFYRGKLHEDLLKLKELIEVENTGVQMNVSIDLLKSALRQYESNFNEFVANQDAFYIKRNAIEISARKIENNILMMKNIFTPESSQIDAGILKMGSSLLQCRRDEKNFLLRHDLASTDSFAQGIQDFRKHETAMRALAGDKAIVGLLDHINTQISIYENAFQDIQGLYDSKSFGAVSDPALSKITDEFTLMTEPAETPSSVETTRSLIEAGRNLEYYAKILPKSSTPLISILQARRWEKNFQQRYDSLTGNPDSRSISYIKTIEQEISNVRDWLWSEKNKGMPGENLLRLELSLDRYEYNLGQFMQNLDAFHIRRKEMIESARDLDRAVQMIKDKVFESTSENDIDGIYYLNPRLPIHGQSEGNYHDVGSLHAYRPSIREYRHCKNWIQFYFDQDGQYVKETVISSIYFHIWIRTVNDSIDIGFEKEGKYSGGQGGMDNFIAVNYDASKGYSTRNGYSLITGEIDMNYPIRGEDIYQFAMKLSRHSGYPSVLMEPNRYSFIIINPPSNKILILVDRDSDGLNDYEEMFVYYTDPYDEDTDGDGLTDGTEALKGTSPNINDLYSGGVIEGISDTPHINNYKTFDGDWIVDRTESFLNSKFTLHGNLIIRSGGTLVLDNCILDMNRKTKDKIIHVEKGGTLNLRKTEIDFNDTGYWYKVVEGEEVEIGSNFDIYGTLNVQESTLRNSLGIKFYQGSNTIIRNSSMQDCYHLSFEGLSDSRIEDSVISNFIGVPIFCKSSSPIIRNTVLNVEYNGVGIYCFNSSPIIDNSKIIVSEDEDSDTSAFIIVENSHPVLSNTHFNTERVKHDDSSGIVIK